MCMRRWGLQSPGPTMSQRTSQNHTEEQNRAEANPWARGIRDYAARQWSMGFDSDAYRVGAGSRVTGGVRVPRKRDQSTSVGPRRSTWWEEARTRAGGGGLGRRPTGWGWMSSVPELIRRPGWGQSVGGGKAEALHRLGATVGCAATGRGVARGEGRASPLRVVEATVVKG
jgi:hypothetical protein